MPQNWRTLHECKHHFRHNTDRYVFPSKVASEQICLIRLIDSNWLSFGFAKLSVIIVTIGNQYCFLLVFWCCFWNRLVCPFQKSTFLCCLKISYFVLLPIRKIWVYKLLLILFVGWLSVLTYIYDCFETDCISLMLSNAKKTIHCGMTIV